MMIGGMERIKPSIVLYKFNDDRPVILQGLYSNKIDLLDIDVDNSNQIITVLTSFRNTRGKYCIGVRSFDEEGHVIENVNIEPPNDIYLLEATSRIMNNQYRIVTGTYKQIKGSYTEGIFIVRMNANGKQETGYFDFYTLYGIPRPLDSLQGKSQDIPINARFRMYWEVTGISAIKNHPAILLEAFNEEERHSVGVTGSSEVIYIYKKGLVIVLNDGFRPEKNFEIEMDGLIHDLLRPNLFVIPYDSVPEIGYFNFNRLGISDLDSAGSSKGRYFISLPEVSGLDTENINIYHNLSIFIPWFGRNYLYCGIKSEKNENSPNEKSMFMEKIVFK
jgi:hypothetical protein